MITHQAPSNLLGAASSSIQDEQTRLYKEQRMFGRELNSMIDVNKETVLTVKQARKILPNRPSINTIYRWFWKGVRGIKLDSIRVGGRIFTSKEACDRFVYASSQIPTEEERFAEQDAIRQARQFLDATGV